MWCLQCIISVIIVNGYIKLPEHPILPRYLLTIYNEYPPFPRYANLLSHYDHLDHNENIKYKDQDLVKKTGMMFVVIGDRRKQTFFTVSVGNILYS